MAFKIFRLCGCNTSSHTTAFEGEYREALVSQIESKKEMPPPPPSRPEQSIKMKVCLGLTEEPTAFMRKYPGQPLRCISHLMDFVHADMEFALVDEANSTYILKNCEITPDTVASFDTCYTDMRILDIDIPAAENVSFMKHVQLRDRDAKYIIHMRPGSGMYLVQMLNANGVQARGSKIC